MTWIRWPQHVCTLAFTAVMALGQTVAQAAPAVAPTARIADAQSTGQRMGFVVAVSGVPAGAKIDVSTLRVTVDGKPVTAQGHFSSSQADGPVLATRETMLVLDASGSMTGARLVAAKAAAMSYLDQLPPDVKAGLVTFADRPSVVVRPTTDRAVLRTALSRVTANGNTSLYDAILAAVAVVHGDHDPADRRLLIVSDGADTTSRQPLTSVTAALKAAGVGADAVGIGLSKPQQAVLTRITASGSGRVTSTTGLGELRSAFVAAAQTFSQRVVVSADTSPRLAGRDVAIAATLQVAGRPLTARSTLHLATLPPTMPSATAASASANPQPQGAARAANVHVSAHAPLYLVALVFLVLMGIGVLLLWSPRQNKDMEKRLEQVRSYRWLPAETATAAVKPADGQVATAALSLVDGVLRSVGARSRVAQDLERAGLRIRPQEWILLRISISAAFIAVLALLLGSLPLGVLFGAILGWLITRVALRIKIGRRCAAFADQLPDVLQMVASSLRSGFSLAQALEGVAREGTEPASSEFARALTESRLGVELEEALDAIALRTKCRDLKWVVMAIRISRDVGGNLAEVILTTVHTMRERAQLKRQIRSLSAEGRLSAYILIGLPIVVAGWFALVRRDYLRPLVTQPAGIVMLMGAVTGVVLGSWWMSRIVKVEV